MEWYASVLPAAYSFRTRMSYQMKKLLKSILFFCALIAGASGTVLAAQPYACNMQNTELIDPAAAAAKSSDGKQIVTYICITALIAVIAVLAVTFRHRQSQSVAAQEHMLRNITNNIDGGVLVQKIGDEAPIIYINDGLLKMLQYTREEFNALPDQYYHNRFVCPEDLPELSDMFHKAATHENGESSFSFHLRLVQKDGHLLPVLLNCSFVDDILYCVMMDNTREHEIIQQLEFERERYRVLFDKSDEILFDVDFITQDFNISKKFKEKFGWDPPKRYWGDDLPELMHFYEDDKPIFSEMLQDINSGKIDGECCIRIYNDKFTPRWCRAIYHVFKQGGESYRLIGKLTDIDREMKEKESLIRKAEIDALTGIYNKATFRSRCCEYLTKSKEPHAAVLFADIDNFKEINDNFGHVAGDKILKDISEKLQELFTADDILGRFGGDEFCVLIKDMDRERLLPILEQMTEELRGEYINDQHILNVSASIGAVLSDEYGLDYELLLYNADKALYFAKKNGKSTYVLYHDDLCLKGYSGRDSRTASADCELLYADK